VFSSNQMQKCRQNRLVITHQSAAVHSSTKSRKWIAANDAYSQFKGLKLEQSDHNQTHNFLLKRYERIAKNYFWNGELTPKAAD